MKTEELNDSSLTSIDEIATNGDIILVVSLEKRKLQVNSGVLKNASKVFNAMFGPHFSEGQNLPGNSPKEVSMPDDNADALTIICRILHLRNDSIPDSLTSSEILQIAIAADKFDCAMRLKFHVAQWLNPGNTQDILELGRLSVASYILDNAWAFEQLTLAMIVRSKDSYIPLADEFGDIIPWKTFWLLAERRTALQMELDQLIVEGASSATCSILWGGCDFPSRHTHAYIKLLRSAKLWPMATASMSISEAIDALEKTGNPTVSLDGIKHCDPYHSTLNYSTKKLDELKNSIGLCLDCVFSGRTAATPDCRIKH